MSNSNSMEELNKILGTLAKHVKLIISMTIITVIVVAIGVFYVVKPKYQATSEIIVNQKLERDAQASELQQVQSTDLQLVNTYKSILKSQTISNAVKGKVGAKTFNSSDTDVDTDTSSQVINISVTSTSPESAAKIANLTAYTFKNKIKSIMNVNNVSVISKAKANNTPVSPKKGLSLLIGLVLGVIIGAFAAIFKESNDKKVDDTDFIVNELGLVDLGEVSDINMKNIKKQTKK